MRRVAIILFVAMSVVAATAALLAAFAVSPPGRDALAAFAERRIARIVGGDVEIGMVVGDLTRRIELRDLRLINDGGDWARVSRITLTWSPNALLSRRVEIGEILIENAEILARPPERERKTPFKGLELPERFPFVAIDRIKVRNLQVGGSLVAEPLRLDGEGAITLGGAEMRVNARIKGGSGRDDISIEINREETSIAPELKVAIDSAADGALAALLNAGGAVAFNLEGNGPLTDYRMDLDGKAGAYGAFSGVISGDLSTMDDYAFDFAASPGARLDRWRNDTGDSIKAAGRLLLAEHGGRLEIESLSGAFGDSDGAAAWRNGARALDEAAIDMAVRFSPAWRGDLQAAFGDKAEFHLSLEKKGGGYGGTASFSAPALDAELTEIATDLRSRVSGTLSIDVSEESAALARLGEPVSGRGAFSLAAQEEIEFRNFKVATESGASFTGEATYRPADRRFAVDGELFAAAAAITALAPAVAPRGPAAGAVTASGSLDNFTLDLSFNAPGFRLKESNWPAATISVALSRLPLSPEGMVSLRAADGSIKSSARVRRVSAGVLALSGIDHRGEGFALTGAAAFNPATWEGAIDLQYAGAEGAEPWPGLEAAGRFSAKGAVARERADNRIEVLAPSFQLESLSLENASVLAQGPLDRLSLTGAADSLSLQNRVRLDGLKFGGAAAVGEKTVIALASAAADMQGTKVRLERAVNVTIGGGVAVDDLALRVGETGSIDASGVIEPNRWRTQATIRDLPISANGSTIDFDLSLDTNNTTLGSGAFSAALGRLGGGEAALNGKFSWDGRRLDVFAGDGNSALDLKLDLPLALRRAGGLKAEMNGALRGAARYKGRAESITAFLPRVLQPLEGDLAFNAALGGTVKDPRVTGDLSLTDGAYTEAISGLSIVDIDLTSSATGTSASSKVTFNGTASGAGQTAKTVTAAGSIDLGGEVAVSAAIALDGARFAAGPVQLVDASGTLKIEGAANDLLLSGDVAIAALKATLFTPERLGLVDIDVIAVGEDGRQMAKSAGARSAGAIRYAVSIAADDKIIVNGRGLDSEWRADAQISGTSAQPLVLGTMNLNRGDLEFGGRRFDITRGSIGFDTLAPNDPTVNLRAERQAGDGATVAVVIAGRSSALKVSLESTPSRPSEDIMALILFDKPANELSAFESLQVADALTQLGGVGVFGGKGVTGAARDALGLDLLNLDVDQTDSSESLLTVGKYVTDGLFISASQNARGENGSLRIEYEIGQSFSVETELRQDGDQTISANWKKDF